MAHREIHFLSDGPFVEWDHDEEARSPSIADAIFQIGRRFVDLLDFNALQSHLWHPKLSFMSPTEIRQVSRIMAPSSKARELMELLFEMKDDVQKLRQFVACLVLENKSKDGHLGHAELVETLWSTIPLRDLNKIERLVKRVQIGWKHPKQVPYVLVSGYLKSKEFVAYEQNLWQYYHKGHFTELREYVDATLCLDENKENADLKIVGFLFKATACIQQSSSRKFVGEALIDLLTALELCDKSQNQLILDGRVRQRIAQVYLYMNWKKSANEYLEQAEQSIVLVGERYDRSKFYLRRAKILAVASPSTREEIETLYALAMSTLNPDSESYPVCHPSVCLAKAAFHLKIAFSSNPVQPLSNVSDDDLRKAKEVIVTLREESLEQMPKRRCEYKLVIGEIYRLEGDVDLACGVFQDVLGVCKEVDYNTVYNHVMARLLLVKELRPMHDNNGQSC